VAISRDVLMFGFRSFSTSSADFACPDNVRFAQKTTKLLPSSEMTRSAQQRKLFDHPIRSGEDDIWNSETQCSSSLEIHGEFKRNRLLDRKITRTGPFEDFVDVISCPSCNLFLARTVAREPSYIHEITQLIDSRYFGLCCERRN
jgi:hypothetical protein